MIATKWLLAYFLFIGNPADPQPCFAPTCSAYVLAESEKACNDALDRLRASPQVQSVGVCVEIGAGAVTVVRPLSEKERVLLEIKSNEKKDGSAS